MRFSARLQVLTCLMMYASSVQAIMVKFGTKDGPIEPPTPEPLPSPQPYRVPAPVWEERSNDTPDPNANWRPPLFVPHPRYTHIVINPSTQAPLPLNSAQRFVSSYVQEHKPIKADIVNPTIFSSQTLPGIGLRYFFPAYTQEQKKVTKQDDAKFNHIEADLAATQASKDSDSDFQWKYEKESTRRQIRNNQEGTARAPGRHVYQFPAYVHPQHR